MKQFCMNFQQNIQYFEKQLAIDKNFDLVDKVLENWKEKGEVLFCGGHV